MRVRSKVKTATKFLLIPHTSPAHYLARISPFALPTKETSALERCIHQCVTDGEFSGKTGVFVMDHIEIADAAYGFEEREIPASQHRKANELFTRTIMNNRYECWIARIGQHSHAAGI